MTNRLTIAFFASTLAVGFVGAAAATQHVSGRTSAMTAQQASFMPVPLCPPTAPTCEPGGPPAMPTPQSR
jgi:hypothetical protein